MGPTFEDALTAIAAEHNLTTISVSITPASPDDFRVNINAHWDGFSRRNLTVASEYGPDVATALKRTLAAAAADRVAFVDQLPPVSLAA